MNDLTNGNNGAGNDYPDVSAIFNVDEKRAAGTTVEKTAEAPRRNERILTAEEGVKHLPKAEQKKMKKAARKERRAAAFKKAKTRAIIILSAALAVAVAVGVIWLRIAEKKKPAVAVSKVTVETVERAYTDAGVIVSDGKGLFAVLIDNDYDVHGIARNLDADLETASGEIIRGKVTEIREEKPGSDSFAYLTSALTGEEPEVPVYTVRVAPEATELTLTAGEKVTVRIVTETAENALSVPASAVLMDGAQPYVWIYHPFTRKLTRQDIAVGVSSDDKTEVLRGLKKGVSVVSGSSAAPSELYDGVRVKMK